MINLSREELLKIATISQIEVTEEEIPALLAQITAILSYTVRVQEFVHLHSQETLIEQALPETRRSDTPHVCSSGTVLAEAPHIENNYFVVPMIIEQS